MLLLLLAQGCSANSPQERWNVVLDAPAQDVTIPLGESLYVRAHSDMERPAQGMSVIVNDVAVAELSVSSQEGNPPLWVGEGFWTPLEAGTYRLFVRLTGVEGTFDSNAVRVTVAGEPTSTPVSPPVVASSTPPPTTASQAPLVELSADATSLNAGTCTFLHWRVDNVQPQSIDLNGQSVPPQGEMQVCPCSTTQYVLNVLAGDQYTQSVTLQVSGSCVTPTSTFTPTIPPPPNELQFWADATTVQAGSCTFLHWDSVNALRVYLNGKDVATSGTKRVCPCTQKTYNLTADFSDGSNQARSLTINVRGSCATPTFTPTFTPTPDTTPPPTPALIGPGNTNGNQPPHASCPITLQWQAVSDPSGVIYQVRLDKFNYSNNTWATIGTWNTSATQYAVPTTTLFCDVGKYRWRVRAVDGANNAGKWSNWFFYEIPLL